jgi:hypothetical protein
MSLRPLVIAAVVAAATAGPAAADGFYFLEGFGGSSFGDEIALQDDVVDGAMNIRGALGRRMGNVAVEVWLKAEIPMTELTVIGDGAGAPRLGDDLVAYGLDLKLIQPISRRWSVYARGGLSRMMDTDSGYAGRGLGATAGIQVAGKVPALGYLWWPLFFLAKDVGPKVHSGLWFEIGHSFYRLHGPGPSIDARITSWTLGFSVGQDF